MIQENELEKYNRVLANRKFKAIELTDDGYVVVFEGDFVIKLEYYGHDLFNTYLMTRKPSYEYMEV